MKCYQREGEKQVQFDESKLSCQEIKKQIYQDIDWENRRSNVDSSKKRAVLQNMDYDGFRQMVLGAHLKTIKKGAQHEIYDSYGTAGNINPIASFDKANNFQQEKSYDEEVVRRTLELSATDELAPPRTAEIFEKFLCKKLNEPMQRYTYMRLMDFS